uniref:calcium-binding protein n=1 Tax=Pseudomonas sp. TWR1-1-3 TaxID=2804624 RepID=UPI003CF6D385
EGDDVLTALSTSYSQTLSGGAGNDRLTGGTGNDTLIGGTGNDTLRGGSGSDTYLFNLGDGKDLIFDDSSFNADTDVVKFGAGILASDLTISRAGTQLVLSHQNGLDSITIDRWFDTADGRYKIERFEFADGTVWNSSALTTPFLTQVGSEGDDVLTALSTSYSQTLSGGAGNDRLTGGTGNDTLIGGTGNDTLRGGSGSDTYLFNLGDGKDLIFDDSSFNADTDVVKFGAGILASDLTISRAGTQLVLSHQNGLDSITIDRWFDTADGRYKVERFEFSDGVRLNSSEVGLMASSAVVKASKAVTVDGYLDSNNNSRFDGEYTLTNANPSDSGGREELKLDDIDLQYLSSFDGARGEDSLVEGGDDQSRRGGMNVELVPQIDFVEGSSTALYANALDGLISAMAAFGSSAGGEVSIISVSRNPEDSIIAVNLQ